MQTAMVSVLTIFAVHGFAFSNLMYTHDGLVIAEDTLTRIKLGRWAGYFYIRYFRDTFAAPWLVGMILTACLVMSVVMVTELFEFTGIKSAVTAFVMTANVAVTAVVATYTKDVDVYGLALLFSCAAVFAYLRFPGGWNIAAPIVFICLSMGFYQAYVSCAPVLFILMVIKKLPDCEKKGIPPLAKEAGIFAGLLAAGAVLYFAVMRLTMALFDAYPGGGYNSPSTVYDLGIGDIFAAVPGIYKRVWKYFFKSSGYNTRRVIILNICILAVVAAGSAALVVRLKRRALFYVVLLALLPSAAGMVLLVSGGVMHELMVYGIGLLYLLPVVLLEGADSGKKPWMYGKIVTVVCLVLISYHNFAYANGAYVCKKLVYDNTKESLRQIWLDVEAMEGYEPGDTDVTVMGSFNESQALSYKSSLLDRYSGFAGMSSSAITYDGMFPHMLEDILGKQISGIRMNDEELEENEEYLSMPAYPHEGYVRWIGDRIVVKL